MKNRFSIFITGELTYFQAANTRNSKTGKLSENRTFDDHKIQISIDKYPRNRCIHAPIAPSTVLLNYRHANPRNFKGGHFKNKTWPIHRCLFLCKQN